MISPLLLRSLFRSEPAHPLYWRRYFYGRKIYVKPERPLYLRILRLVMFAVLILAMIVLPLLIFVTLPLAGLIPIGIVLPSTILGAHAAMHVAQRIRHEQDDRRFDVISTTKGGGIGLCWAMTARYIRVDNTALQLRRLFFTVYALIGGAAVCIAIIVILMTGITFNLVTGSMGVSIQDTASANTVWIISSMFGALMLVGFMALDSLQSLVMGVLLGLIVPHISRMRTDAGVTALGMFLALQIALYVGMSGAALIFPPLLLFGLQIDFGVAISFFQVGIALLLREAVNIALWRVACHLLNTDVDELRVLSAPK